MKKNLFSAVMAMAVIASTIGGTLAYTGTTAIAADETNETLTIDLTNNVYTYKTSVSGTKTWDDGEDKQGLRPDETTVYLYANGEATGDSYVLSEATNWTYEFTDLSSYEDGELISYSIKEDVPYGYNVDYGTAESQTTTDEENSIIYTATTIDLTNSVNDYTMTIKGTKTWNDNNDAQGLRPDEITVYLYADGEATGDSYVLSEATNWTYEFTNLPKYDNGEAISYSIKEDVPFGYKVSYITE